MIIITLIILRRFRIPEDPEEAMNHLIALIIFGVTGLFLYCITSRKAKQLIIRHFLSNERDFYMLAQLIDAQYPVVTNGYKSRHNIRIEVAGENPPDTQTQQYMSNLRISTVEIETEKIDAEIRRTIKFLIREIDGTRLYDWYCYGKGNIKDGDIRNDTESGSVKIKKINDDWGFYRSIEM